MRNRSEADDSTNKGISDNVHRELLSILYRQTKHMIWAEAFASSLILFILWWPGTVSHQLLLTWYGLMLVITLPRYILANTYERIHPIGKPSILWERIIMVMLLGSALGWSFAGTVLLPKDNVLNQALVLFLLVGVAATANPFYSPIKKVYAIFAVPTLSITAIFLMTRGTNLEVFLGLALLSFAILMLTTAIVSSSLITSALRFRFQNMKLAEDLLRSNETLEIMATHDTLTTLPNRQFFNTLLNKTVTTAHKQQATLQVLFLDIDKFKSINDSLGHDVGDQLLKEVAKRLAENFKDVGTVSRLGGDEFVVIINQNITHDTVAKLAALCCSSIAKPVQMKHQTLYVTTSIGISEYPQDGEDAESLLTHADMAMYKVKQNGGNGFHFYGNKNVLNLDIPDEII